MQVFNQTQSTVIVGRLTIANSLFKRMKGLLGRASLSPKEGLLIESCQAIHMYFMKFPIDAVFIDGKKTVVGLVKTIQPFQVSPYFWEARSVIEVPVGTIADSRTAVGDQIVIKD